MVSSSTCHSCGTQKHSIFQIKPSIVKSKTLNQRTLHDLLDPARLNLLDPSLLKKVSYAANIAVVDATVDVALVDAAANDLVDAALVDATANDLVDAALVDAALVDATANDLVDAALMDAALVDATANDLVDAAAAANDLVVNAAANNDLVDTTVDADLMNAAPSNVNADLVVASHVDISYPITGLLDSLIFKDKDLSVVQENQKEYQLRHYMLNQPNFSNQMRNQLMEWLAEVIWDLKAPIKALYIAANLFDRYAACKILSKDFIQLIGIGCVSLACKSLQYSIASNLSDYAESTWTLKEISETEAHISFTLQNKISPPTPLEFLMKLLPQVKASSEIITLAYYLCQMSLLDYSFIRYEPSRIASSALLLSLCTHGEEYWSLKLQQSSGYVIEDLYICVSDMADYFDSLIDEPEPDSLIIHYPGFNPPEYLISPFEMDL